jgi:hypothetical protein
VVGSHSCSHPLRIFRCPQSQLEREWTQSARILSDLLGESRPEAPACPRGPRGHGRSV